MAGSGKGLSMVTPCSSAISRSRTSRDRSMRRSRGQERSAQIGQSTPTMTSVVRTPTWSSSSEVTMAPTPMDSATRLSSTPKTRASTSSGAILPMSVKPPRSISAFPTPRQASMTQGHSLLWDDADQDHRHAPQRHPHGEPATEPPGVDQQRCGERAQDRPGPDRGVQEADPGRPRVQQVDGDHDRQHGERATNQGLRHREAHDQRQVTAPADRTDSLGSGAQQVAVLGGAADAEVPRSAAASAGAPPTATQPPPC